MWRFQTGPKKPDGNNKENRHDLGTHQPHVGTRTAARDVASLHPQHDHGSRPVRRGQLPGRSQADGGMGGAAFVARLAAEVALDCDGGATGACLYDS